MIKLVAVVVVCLVVLNLAVVHVEAGASKHVPTSESDSSKRDRRNYQKTAEDSLKRTTSYSDDKLEKVNRWTNYMLMTKEKGKSHLLDGSFPGSKKKEVAFDRELATCLVRGNEDKHECESIENAKCVPCLDSRGDFTSAVCVPARLVEDAGDCKALRKGLRDRAGVVVEFVAEEDIVYPGEMGTRFPWEELLAVYDSLRRTRIMADLRLRE